MRNKRVVMEEKERYKWSQPMLSGMEKLAQFVAQKDI